MLCQQAEIMEYSSFWIEQIHYSKRYIHHHFRFCIVSHLLSRFLHLADNLRNMKCIFLHHQRCYNYQKPWHSLDQSLQIWKNILSILDYPNPILHILGQKEPDYWIFVILYILLAKFQILYSILYNLLDH